MRACVTRRALAEAAATTVETAIRVLRGLHRQGIIHGDVRRIAVLDECALRRLAGELERRPDGWSRSEFVFDTDQDGRRRRPAGWRRPRAVDMAKPLGQDEPRVKRVRIGEFRDRASELIRRAANGETVVILNRNREVAKIVPIGARTPDAQGLVGCLARTASVHGDITSPIAPPDRWFRT